MAMTRRINILTGDFLELLDGALPYWKSAEVTGVDPGLLAQLVLWETPHWTSFWEYVD